MNDPRDMLRKHGIPVRKLDMFDLLKVMRAENPVQKAKQIIRQKQQSSGSLTPLGINSGEGGGGGGRTIQRTQVKEDVVQGRKSVHFQQQQSSSLKQSPPKPKTVYKKLLEKLQTFTHQELKKIINRDPSFLSFLLSRYEIRQHQYRQSYQRGHLHRPTFKMKTIFTFFNKYAS